MKLDKASFTSKEFYDGVIADIEQLFIDEWAITLDFCRLLVLVYQEETGQKNGATFLKTTNPGTGIDRLNAPYRLALDIERLEVAYTQYLMDQQGQSAILTLPPERNPRPRRAILGTGSTASTRRNLFRIKRRPV